MATATINRWPGGPAASVETITANAAGSTTPTRVIGPPRDPTAYDGKAQGVYIRQTSSNYVWVFDERINAAATVPTTYTADNV